MTPLEQLIDTWRRYTESIDAICNEVKIHMGMEMRLFLKDGNVLLPFTKEEMAHSFFRHRFRDVTIEWNPQTQSLFKALLIEKVCEATRFLIDLLNDCTSKEEVQASYIQRHAEEIAFDFLFETKLFEVPQNVSRDEPYIRVGQPQKKMRLLGIPQQLFPSKRIHEMTCEGDLSWLKDDAAHTTAIEKYHQRIDKLKEAFEAPFSKWIEDLTRESANLKIFRPLTADEHILLRDGTGILNVSQTLHYFCNIQRFREN